MTKFKLLMFAFTLSFSFPSMSSPTKGSDHIKMPHPDTVMDARACHPPKCKKPPL